MSRQSSPISPSRPRIVSTLDTASSASTSLAPILPTTNRRLSAHEPRRTTHDSPPPIPWDFELTAPIDARLNALARAGRADPTARNALHALLVGKIARFLAPWRGRRTALGDFEDLSQEAFLVFAALVADWPGEGSFARYFLGFFPWRLRHAIEAHARRWPADRLLVVSESALLAAEPGVEDAPDPLLPFWPLPEEDRRLLLLRLRGHGVAEAARLLGWSRRTAFRRWGALVARLGADAEEGGAARRVS